MSAIGINTFAMVGRLTGDAVYKAIGTDSSLLSFSLAQTRGWGDKQHPLFMPCKMWGKTAATLQNYMTKGQQVACSGNLDQDDWTDETGKNVLAFISMLPRLSCFQNLNKLHNQMQLIQQHQRCQDGNPNYQV